MDILKKINDILNYIRIILLVIILSLCILMCVVNIVLRYLIQGVSFLRPFPWVNELMQMGAIWIAFLAAGLGVRENSHISLESFVARFFPSKVAIVVRKAAQLIVLLTLALLIVVGIRVTIKQSSSFLQNLPVSNAWFYAAIPVGCFYLFYDYLLIFIFGKHPFTKDADENTRINNAF
ncbi:MAG: TRAP transporter small permease [Clostridiales bacterium]|nr:TRAP transporter small permease [Clostridiales bacterium]